MTKQIEKLEPEVVETRLGKPFTITNLNPVELKINEIIDVLNALIEQK